MPEGTSPYVWQWLTSEAPKCTNFRAVLALKATSVPRHRLDSRLWLCGLAVSARGAGSPLPAMVAAAWRRASSRPRWWWPSGRRLLTPSLARVAATSGRAPTRYTCLPRGLAPGRSRPRAPAMRCCPGPAPSPGRAPARRTRRPRPGAAPCPWRRRVAHPPGRALVAASGVARHLKWPALRRGGLLTGGKKIAPKPAGVKGVNIKDGWYYSRSRARRHGPAGGWRRRAAVLEQATRRGGARTRPGGRLRRP
jgi:hypothetical protein